MNKKFTLSICGLAIALGLIIVLSLYFFIR
jgi:hypothetical protein